MFNFGSTTQTNTSFLGQSTPVNQTRSGSGFLFNSTTTQPSTLTSTPFASTSLFGKKILINRNRTFLFFSVFQEEQHLRLPHFKLRQMEPYINSMQLSV